MDQFLLPQPSVVSLNANDQENALILRLPNELLSEIFNHITPFPVISNSLCRRFDFSKPSPVFSIRSTCRRFRAVCNELGFWREDDTFDLVDLIYRRHVGSCSLGNPQLDLQSQYEHFFRTLLADEHLLQFLVRRSYWRFNNLSSLLTTIRYIPQLTENAISVTLTDQFDDEEPTVNGYVKEWGLQKPSSSHLLSHSCAYLGVCRGLISLEIGYSIQSVDLDVIVGMCPHLRTLRIRQNKPPYGTLEGLSKLQTLLLQGTLGRLLPLQSTMSLTKLTIIHNDDHRMDQICKEGILDAFFNLKSFFVSPITDEVCHFICRSRILKLLDFRFGITPYWITPYVPRVNMLGVVRMFSSQMLHKVQELRFSVVANGDGPDYYPRIFSTIASHLDELHKLTVRMEFNALWIETLSTLISLQKLTWYVPEADCSITADSKHPSDTDVADECAKVFGHTIEKLAIRVKTWKSCDSGFEKLWGY